MIFSLYLSKIIYYRPVYMQYGQWSSFRASTSFRVFAAYLTISQPI